MTHLTFSININAPKEKVWEVLWQDENYRAWTSVFAPGSHAISDWQRGSKVLFLDSKNDGMVSTIADIVPNSFMSFKHMGVVNKGKEDYENEEMKKWAGALENYTLAEENGVTHLEVDMDMSETEQPYFEKIWPAALQKIKELAE